MQWMQSHSFNALQHYLQAATGTLPPGLKGEREWGVGGWGWLDLSHCFSSILPKKEKKKSHKTAAEKKQRAKVLITNAAIGLAKAAT